MAHIIPLLYTNDLDDNPLYDFYYNKLYINQNYKTFCVDGIMPFSFYILDALQHPSTTNQNNMNDTTHTHALIF